MMFRKTFCNLCVLAALGAATGVYAQEPGLASMTVQQRLQRLERLVSPDVLMEQAQQNDMLREEITSLREQIEQQQYELETIKQRQRSLYLDMDRRLTNLEAGATNVSRSPVPPPNTATGATGSAVPPPVSNVGAGAPTAATGAADAKQAYSAAFELLKEGRYARSIKAFETFLKQYPDSQYVDNAQYWMAEANYVSREYKTALTEFEKLIAQHPDSTKIPGARLKIGYVYYELKNWPQARASLEKVIKMYPDTSVAKKARERLARMKREGH